MTENNFGNNNFSPNNNNVGSNPPTAPQGQGPQNTASGSVNNINNQQFARPTQNTNTQPQNPAQQSGAQNNFQAPNMQNTTRPQGQSPVQPQQPLNTGAPQMPKQNLENKKVLTEEDKQRLRNMNDGNAEIKKMKKRVKKPTLTENARPLYKVRRLYSARLSHRLYFEHMLEIARLRAIAGESGKKGAALIGAAAKKTRNLVATLLIVFAILAVIGTGTLVTVLVINQDQRDYNLLERLDILNQSTFTDPISNYQLGTNINRQCTVLNNDEQDLFIEFSVTMRANETLQNAITQGTTDLTLDQLECNLIAHNSSDWIYEGNSLYYIGELAVGSQLTILDGYNITLRDGFEQNSAEWSNGSYGVILDFEITYYSVGGVSIDELNWPQAWENAYNERF